MAIDTDLNELERISATLRSGAASLDGPSESAPDAPDAGESSGLITGKLLEISGAILAMHEDLDQLADKVARSRDTYHEIDIDNADRMKPN